MLGFTLSSPTQAKELLVRFRHAEDGRLLTDDDRWRHFAVVPNMDWNCGLLLRWHREKQGTVESGHGVTNNDLGGGVTPIKAPTRRRLWLWPLVVSVTVIQTKAC